MKVYVITKHSTGRVTVRTTSVSKKYRSGPKQDCTQVEAQLSQKAAREIAKQVI